MLSSHRRHRIWPAALLFLWIHGSVDASAASVKVSVDVRVDADVNIGARWYRGGGDLDCGGGRPASEDKSQGTKKVSGTLRIDPLPTDDATRDAISKYQESEISGAGSLAGDVAELHRAFGWVSSAASGSYEDVRRTVSEVESPSTDGGRDWLRDAKAGGGGTAGASYRRLKAWTSQIETTAPQGYALGVRLPRTDLTTDFGLGWNSYSARRTNITGSLRTERSHVDIVTVAIDDWLNPNAGTLHNQNDCGHIEGAATPNADLLTGTVTLTYAPPPGVFAILVTTTVDGFFDNVADFPPQGATRPVEVTGILHKFPSTVPLKFVAWRTQTDGPLTFTYHLNHSRGTNQAAPSLTSKLEIAFEPLGLESKTALTATQLRDEIRRLVALDQQSREPDRLIDLLVTLIAKPDMVDPMVSTLTPSAIYQLSDDLFRFEMSMSTANPNLTLDTKVAARIVGYEVAKAALSRFAPLCATVTLPLPFAQRTPPRRIGGLLYTTLWEAKSFLQAMDSNVAIRYSDVRLRTASTIQDTGSTNVTAEDVIRGIAESPDGIEGIVERTVALRAALVRKDDYFRLRRLETTLTALSTAHQAFVRAVVQTVADESSDAVGPSTRDRLRSSVTTLRKASTAAKAVVDEMLRRVGFEDMDPDDLSARALILDAHILNLLEPGLDDYLEPVRLAFVPSPLLQQLRQQAARCVFGELK